jgi:LacI family transcriptional regulator
MGAREATTIHDVARAAGVSVSTVSNVLTGNRPVAGETRDRVLQVVAELGFRPNRLARGLVSRTSRTLGVVASGLEYYGPSRALVGADQEATEQGYTLVLNLIHQPDREDVGSIVADLLTHQVDGIIWSIPQVGQNRIWWKRTHTALKVPVVFIDMDPNAGFVTINIDNCVGGERATTHLIERGRRHIGLITGPLDWWAAQQRQLGWRAALAAARLPATPCQVAFGNWSAASGEQGFHTLLDQFPAMDAVFASNDQMALGAMRAARSRNVRIPEDVAMVGYDDIPEAEFLHPSLTTVHQQVIESGRLAVREVTRLIGARNADANGEEEQGKLILLQPELIVRASSGANP